MSEFLAYQESSRLSQGKNGKLQIPEKEKDQIQKLGEEIEKVLGTSIPFFDREKNTTDAIQKQIKGGMKKILGRDPNNPGLDGFDITKGMDEKTHQIWLKRLERYRQVGVIKYQQYNIDFSDTKYGKKTAELSMLHFPNNKDGTDQIQQDSKHLMVYLFAYGSRIDKNTNLNHPHLEGPIPIASLLKEKNIPMVIPNLLGANPEDKLSKNFWHGVDDRFEMSANAFFKAIKTSYPKLETISLAGLSMGAVACGVFAKIASQYGIIVQDITTYDPPIPHLASGVKEKYGAEKISRIQHSLGKMILKGQLKSLEEIKTIGRGVDIAKKFASSFETGGVDGVGLALDQIGMNKSSIGNSDYENLRDMIKGQAESIWGAWYIMQIAKNPEYVAENYKQALELQNQLRKEKGLKPLQINIGFGTKSSLSGEKNIDQFEQQTGIKVIRYKGEGHTPWLSFSRTGKIFEDLLKEGKIFVPENK